MFDFSIMFQILGFILMGLDYLLPKKKIDQLNSNINKFLVSWSKVKVATTISFIRNNTIIFIALLQFYVVAIPFILFGQFEIALALTIGSTLFFGSYVIFILTLLVIDIGARILKSFSLILLKLPRGVLASAGFILTISVFLFRVYIKKHQLID